LDLIVIVLPRISPVPWIFSAVVVSKNLFSQELNILLDPRTRDLFVSNLALKGLLMD